MEQCDLQSLFSKQTLMLQDTKRFDTNTRFMAAASRQARAIESRQLLCDSQTFPAEIAALGLEAPRFVWTQCELMRQRVCASKVTFLCLNAAVTASFNIARGKGTVG